MLDRESRYEIEKDEDMGVVLPGLFMAVGIVTFEAVAISLWILRVFVPARIRGYFVPTAFRE